jgi:plasmid maintenance system antidote protein VapI
MNDKLSRLDWEIWQFLHQHVIAVHIGIDPATLSQYINDKLTTVNWEVWHKLANYFGVSGDEIFNVQPDETVSSLIGCQ